MIGVVVGWPVTTSQVSKAGGDGEGDDRQEDGSQDGCMGPGGVVDGSEPDKDRRRIGGESVEDGWGED